MCVCLYIFVLFDKLMFLTIDDKLLGPVGSNITYHTGSQCV